MSEIPKQYDPAAAQEKWAQFWDEKRFFQSNPNPNKQPYCIVIPPPNVTGALHMGHALNNSLQDIMIRMKRMQGFETLWIPGVDHAGIATQAVVEKRLFEEEKKTRHDIGREALVQRIWAWKDQYQARIINQLKVMGCSCDWSKTRFTLDEVCVKAVRHFFFKLFQEGLIYRGKRLVNWDTLLQTAVSDDEVKRETVDGNFWYIKYPVIEPGPGEPEYVVVATTRPETMLGDTAVAVHPDPEKQMDKVIAELEKRLAAAPEKEKADLQKELEDIQERKRSGILDELKLLAKMAENGKSVRLPIMDRPIPLVADHWAKPEKGTGCVKITPAHDPNDYQVGIRQNLPMINILNKDGTLNEQAGSFEGMKIMKAREAVVSQLESLGLLLRVEKRTIDLAHSDRSKTPIEPFLNDQWFISMDQLAQSAMDSITSGEVKIIPSRYSKSYLDWLSEKRDWPIGRQLWWGHRIPVWYCKGASEAELKKAFEGRSDVCWIWNSENEVWWICSQEAELAEDAVPGYTLVQEDDVLDTWFSSALWPHSTLGWPNETDMLKYYYPTSTLITNRDIITLWVARMVLAGKFNTGKKPFEDVYIHPKILDKYGEGMSKSKGNGVDPLSVVAKFGVDALRFALAFLTTENQDIRLMLDFECPHCGAVVEQTKTNRIQPRIACAKCKKPFKTQWAETDEDKALPEGPMIGERFEVARNFCNKLWNASRFVLMSLEEHPLTEQAEISAKSNAMLLEDRWILSRLATVCRDVTDSLESYRYADAMRQLYDFAWDEFCSFYLEMVKSRLFDDTARPAAQQVLLKVLQTLLRLLHPVVPFVTEEIWQRLRTIRPELAESITIADWPKPELDAIDTETEQRFKVFQEVLRALRDVRASRNVPPKTEITFALRCDQATQALLQPMEPYFQSMARSKATAWGEVTAPALCAAVPLAAGMDLYVDISELIDIKAEIAKLEKELTKLDGFIKGKEAKLNSDFVNKAPAAVVEKERQSLNEFVQQRQSALNSLEQLKRAEK